MAKWPVAVLFDEQAEKDGDLIRDVIGAVRTYKSEHKLSLNSELEMVEIIGDAIGQVRRLRGRHLLDGSGQRAEAGLEAESGGEGHRSETAAGEDRADVQGRRQRK